MQGLWFLPGPDIAYRSLHTHFTELEIDGNDAMLGGH